MNNGQIPLVCCQERHNKSHLGIVRFDSTNQVVQAKEKRICGRDKRQEEAVRFVKVVGFKGNWNLLCATSPYAAGRNTGRSGVRGSLMVNVNKLCDDGFLCRGYTSGIGFVYVTIFRVILGYF